MDVLSEVLGALRLKGTLYFSTDFRPPWGLRVPAYRRVARFHLVVRGGLWVRVEGQGEPIWLEAGDLILIANGAEHVLADTRDTPCRTVDQVVRDAGFTGRGALTIAGGDDGAPTRLVCGHFEFDEEFRHPFFDGLPPAIVIRWDDYTRGSPLENAFQFVVREVEAGRPGNEAVVNRLSEVLFVQAIRCWVDRAARERGMMAAIADPGLGAALAAFHADIGSRWTVDDLAHAAAMGRTALSTRFREVLGITPLQYLTSWRMQTAKRLLAESRRSLDQIARAVGYESSASFSRTFRREIGMRPGAFRHRAGERGMAGS